MSEISGIKYIEFVIEASGHGAVNFNGSLNPDPNFIKKKGDYDNIVYPKSRDGSLIISRAAIRSALFDREARNFAVMGKIGFSGNSKSTSSDAVTHPKPDTAEKAAKIAASFHGLLRGYMFADTESMVRASPLFLTDFSSKEKNNYSKEVGVNHNAYNDDGSKASNSLYYTHNWGDVTYEARGAISIEQLQFVSCDNEFGRSSLDVRGNSKKERSALIGAFHAELKHNLSILGEKHKIENYDLADAVYGRYIRKETLFKHPEVGYLLNDKAIEILITEMLFRLKTLSIMKNTGYMSVTSLKLNASESQQVFTHSEYSEMSVPTEYAQYYELEEVE